MTAPLIGAGACGTAKPVAFLQVGNALVAGSRVVTILASSAGPAPNFSSTLRCHPVSLVGGVVGALEARRFVFESRECRLEIGVRDREPERSPGTSGLGLPLRRAPPGRRPGRPYTAPSPGADGTPAPSACRDSSGTNQVRKRLRKRRIAKLPLRIVFVERHEHADAPHSLPLLRPRCEWPRRRRAEAGNEFAPPHGRSSEVV